MTDTTEQRIEGYAKGTCFAAGGVPAPDWHPATLVIRVPKPEPKVYEGQDGARFRVKDGVLENHRTFNGWQPADLRECQGHPECLRAAADALEGK